MVRKWLKKHLHLYDIEDLIVGGNCGCCGAWMPEDIFPKYWRWGLCKKCIEGGDNRMKEMWVELRAKESRGFISKRIVPSFLFLHEFLYGSSFHINYKKFKRVLFPWEISYITYDHSLSFECDNNQTITKGGDNHMNR